MTRATQAPVRLSTRDIGLAIRDFIENRAIMHFVEMDHDGHETLEETDDGAEIVFVDASDPDNLTVHLDTGQTFTVRIVAGDPPRAPDPAGEILF